MSNVQPITPSRFEAQQQRLKELQAEIKSLGQSMVTEATQHMFEASRCLREIAHPDSGLPDGVREAASSAADKIEGENQRLTTINGRVSG